MKKFNSQITIDTKTDLARKNSKKKKFRTYRVDQYPTERYGNNVRCNIFESINHLASKCPDKGNAHDTNNIILFQSNLNTITCFKNFTGEAFRAAV